MAVNAKDKANNALQGLADITAAVATFLATPVLYGKTNDWVVGFTTNHYGPGYEGIISVVWFGLCGATVFGVSRATIWIAIGFGMTSIAARLL